MQIAVFSPGHPAGCLMAGTLLHYYLREKVEIYCVDETTPAPSRLLRTILEEDGFAISESAIISGKSPPAEAVDHLLVFAKTLPKELPKNLNFNKITHFPIPFRQEERTRYYRKLRETIKRDILLFIGKELHHS